jgi:hypothetical protein
MIQKIPLALKLTLSRNVRKWAMEGKSPLYWENTDDSNEIDIHASARTDI